MDLTLHTSLAWKAESPPGQIPRDMKDSALFSMDVENSLTVVVDDEDGDDVTVWPC